MTHLICPERFLGALPGLIASEIRNIKLKRYVVHVVHATIVILKVAEGSSEWSER